MPDELVSSWAQSLGLRAVRYDPTSKAHGDPQIREYPQITQIYAD